MMLDEHANELIEHLRASIAQESRSDDEVAAFMIQEIQCAGGGGEDDKREV